MPGQRRLPRRFPALPGRVPCSGLPRGPVPARAGVLRPPRAGAPGRGAGHRARRPGVHGGPGHRLGAVRAPGPDGRNLHRRGRLRGGRARAYRAARSGDGLFGGHPGGGGGLGARGGGPCRGLPEAPGRPGGAGRLLAAAGQRHLEPGLGAHAQDQHLGKALRAVFATAGRVLPALRGAGQGAPGGDISPGDQTRRARHPGHGEPRAQEPHPGDIQEPEPGAGVRGLPALRPDRAELFTGERARPGRTAELGAQPSPALHRAPGQGRLLGGRAGMGHPARLAPAGVPGQGRDGPEFRAAGPAPAGEPPLPGFRLRHPQCPHDRLGAGERPPAEGARRSPGVSGALRHGRAPGAGAGSRGSARAGVRSDRGHGARHGLPDPPPPGGELTPGLLAQGLPGVRPERRPGTG